MISARPNQQAEAAPIGQPPRPSASRPSRQLLFLTRTYEYGGAEKHLLELISRIPRTGIQISILCLGSDPYTERLGPDANVRVESFPSTPTSLWAWARLFRNARPDIVVFVYGWVWSLDWMASIGAWFARIPKRYSIQHLVLPANPNRGPIHRAIRSVLGPLNLRISAALFHATICVSDAVKNSLVRDVGFPARNMRTIPNGVSLAEFVPSPVGGEGIRAKLRIGPEEFVLLCAARLTAQKGIDILLEALAKCLRTAVPYKCIVVGDGPMRSQLLDQSDRLGLSDRVFFEGFQRDVRPYLQASSAFILASHAEGLPLAILEALACGLPCIVTDVGGNAEAVTDGINGFVVPPASPDAVAAAIARLVTHPSDLSRMSKMARARVCESFDIEKKMQEIASVVLA